jgi:membrane protein DedA with SNARE-associated domain
MICFFAKSFFEVIVAILIFVVIGFVADVVAYTKMYKFWLNFIHKIPEDSKTKQILDYYSKYPTFITIVGTYSAYTNSLLAPFAKKYNLNIKQFWIPRILCQLIVLIVWGLIWYLLKENARQLNDLLTSIGAVIVIGTIVALVINVFLSYKYLSSVRFIEYFKKYFNKRK